MPAEGLCRMFITFEGIEGSGKTTQAHLVYRWLNSFDLPVVLTREPGGTETGEKIRAILLDPAGKVSPLTEAFLYLAARSQLVKQVIKPATDSGRIVLCDRFSDSFLAYQGYGRGLDLELLIRLNEAATGGIEPDLTFLFDLPVDKAFSRLKEHDRMEREDREFHERVRKGFLQLAEAHPERIRIIDATRPEDAVFQQIKEELSRVLALPA